MADSNNPRPHRTYELRPRERAGDEPHNSDPLAELARLIGQNDPFAEYERNRAAEAARSGRAPVTAPPVTVAPEVPNTPAAPDPYAYMPPPEQHAVSHGSEAYAQHPGEVGSDAGDAGTYPVDQHGYAVDAQGYPVDAQGYPLQGYDPVAYATDPDGYGAYPGYDPYHSEDGHILDEAEYHAQLERRRSRRRMIAVVAILALAVFGGAAAFGYRTFFGTVERASPPPVIKADTTPAKVIPAIQGGDAASNKLIYDQVGENNQPERVVPREEKPVDIKTATIMQTPRVVSPTPDANAVTSTPVATIPVTGQNTGGHVLPVASEPSIATPGSGAILPSAKKVRTVIIRPDMTVAPNTGSGPEPTPRSAPPSRTTAAPPPQPAAPPPPSRVASAPPPAPAVVRAVAPEPAPAPVRVAPPSRASAEAPLSLSPGGAEPPAPAPVQTPRAQARPAAGAQPLSLAAAPPTTPSEPRATAGANGSYLVQVSSQRSESEASAAYRTLQARYPNVLGGRASIVRRADLGSRGIYYRTMVGPFANAEQAVQFCSSLKAAGGQCIIHRN